MADPISAATIRASLRAIMEQRQHAPAVRATYRLQFSKEFTFTMATDLVPYLADLGISHVYASPVFQAAPGSMHGYDVVDYSRLNDEIGTREEFDRFVRTLHQSGMGLVVDYVPNHMGIEGGANPWWQDVLEHGELSRYADYFDVDWTPLKPELRGKVLLPFLGDQYGAVLERGELKLVYGDGGFYIDYWGTPFPIDPQTSPIILRAALENVRPLLSPDDLDALEFETISDAFDRLPDTLRETGARALIEQRFREATVNRTRLAALCVRNAQIQAAIDEVVTRLNGTAGKPESFDGLDALLGAQRYRLSFWRVASEEINYRRFFAINTLAAIRQEDRTVFADCHRFLISLIADGAIEGVRFDHPDGLWDPERYFFTFQAACLRELLKRSLQIESDTEWTAISPEVDEAITSTLRTVASGDRRWPVWSVGEKILEQGEPLPTSWALDGTVGYEFMQAATGVLVDQESRAMFDTIYQRFTGEKIRYPDLAYDMKMRQVREAFASETNVLTNAANRISESNRHSRDFTVNILRAALREILACFPVYRTYTTCRAQGVTERDDHYIREAVTEAKRRNRAIDASVFDFLQGALLLHMTAEPSERSYAPCHFAMKLQQLSGPVMAKGVEDTAFYRFNRLVSLNEVGGNPASFGTTVNELHRQNEERLQVWPRSMINSSTHDTKRSEDVRARISVLSERPTEWRAAINRWTRLNRKHRTKIDGALAPTKSDEYVIFQTLIGTRPLAGRSGIDATYRSRLQEYMIKVVREAGRFSDWLVPNEPYEEALTAYIAGILNARRSKAFLDDFSAFEAAQRDAGLLSALGQHVLKLTAPGVPDVYQGTELWDDSLVDPDNRRPVDFTQRATQLAGMNATDMSDVIANRNDGVIKLALTAKILDWRRNHREVFESGSYIAVKARGPASDHVIAFLRRDDRHEILVVLPRLLWKLAGTDDIYGNTEIWRETTLSLPNGAANGDWTNLLTNEACDDGKDLTKVFAAMPLAVLVRERSDA